MAWSGTIIRKMPGLLSNGLNSGGWAIADPNLDQLQDAIGAVSALIDLADGLGLIIDGVAVSLLTVPRYTGDVDAMILQRDRSFEEIIALPERAGLKHRISDPLSSARQNRMLLLVHEKSGIQVDVSLGALEFEEAMVREASSNDFHGVRVRLPKPEHLILMKAFAGRNRDVSDLYTLIEAFPDFDRKWVRQSVAELAELIESQWIVDQFDQVLLNSTR
jgi:hypothetical protein